MTKPRVYVETTIPSFYHDARTTPDIVARREWTRLWWSDAGDRYELVTSAAVVAELAKGPPDRSAEWLAFVGKLPQLDMLAAIDDIVATYVQRQVMPKDLAGDALHLALSSFHRCDFLVTWNCKHLANANKFGHIRRVNNMLGLFVPNIVTPLELLGGRDELQRSGG